MSEPLLTTARRAFYDLLVDNKCLITANGIASIADKDSDPSCAIAAELFKNLDISAVGSRLPGQRAGALFEQACAEFLMQTFLNLGNIRPGNWKVLRKATITQFYQYEHLSTLAELASDNLELASAMVSDYLVKPDVVVARYPVSDEQLHFAVDKFIGRSSPLRASNSGKPLLHASVSCKWTIRSDRSQNTRSEALSLVRNRKGPLPHIVAITAEPLPQRIASIALGTGDMDCVYHMALPELEQAVNAVGNNGAQKSLATMMSGKLLRDIADLPLDLCI
ncbi:MAG: restriction endonuclease [Dehalococcoidia bacterium]|nr:restriction endonuclease [Dehalococcoidia bacterium]